MVSDSVVSASAQSSRPVGGGDDQMRGGDDRADRIETLVRDEAPRLLAYFLRRLDSQPDAADLLGEVLLVIWRRAADVPTDPAEARMWMFGVARKVLATSRRGASRRLALADRLRSEIALDQRSAALNGLPVEPAEDKLDLVRHALRRLRPADRDIISLVDGDGFSLVEAAAILGVRPGSARSRYSRARRRLRIELDRLLAAAPEGH